MKHHERREPAPPSRHPAAGLVLATVIRDNGDVVRVIGHIHPRPHVRIEVTREGRTRHVSLALAELGTVATALLGAVRKIAGQGGEPGPATGAVKA